MNAMKGEGKREGLHLYEHDAFDEHDNIHSVAILAIIVMGLNLKRAHSLA